MQPANIRQDSKIFLPPDRDICKISTFAIITAFTNTYQVSIHNSCLCNELIALTNRHLIDRSYINFSYTTWMEALKYSLPILKLIDVEQTSIWKIAKEYSGGKRKQYLRACEMLEVEGLMRKDSILKMFVKPDKYPLGDISSKPPRAIQYRTPKYNLALASYLKDFEHKFYQVKTTNTVDIAKGRNQVQRAEDLIAKASNFKNPIFLNTDYSKMDSCVRIEHQKSIFRHVYLKKFPSLRLKRLLFAQLNNKGYSKNGIKYKVKGTRCSGDFTTGFENTLINWIILRYICVRAGIYSEYYIDGDDAVIIMEESDRNKFESYHYLFEKLGFEVKMKWSNEIEQVDFCQSRVLLADPPRMARNPLRALSNFNISLKYYPAKIWPRLILAKANSEYYGNPGVPILSKLGERIRNIIGTNIKPMYDKDQEEIIKLNKDLNLLIDDDVRQSYYNCWEISPYEQELIEQDPNLELTFNSEYYESVASLYQTLATTSESLN